MLERRSALAAAQPYRSERLRIAEHSGFALTQVAGHGAETDARLARLIGPLPETSGRAQVNGGLTLFRIAPAQFWIIGPPDDDTAARLEGHCAVTPLSHSRVRIAIEGVPARAVLAKLIPIDLHEGVFTAGSVAMTGLHHTPVTLHCTGEQAFDIYVMRTFAMTVWDVLTDAALEFAGR